MENEKRSPEHGKRKSPEQHKKLAELLGRGEDVTKALAAAGWSEHAAKQGWAAVPQSVFALLPKKAQRLARLGKETTREMREHLLLGRLLDNVTQGRDNGTLSAKVLGSHRESNLWQPEVAGGVIVIQAPPVRESALQEPPDINAIVEGRKS